MSCRSPSPVSDHRVKSATAATYAVLALTMADNTTVGVAVPRVRESFHLGVASLQWVVAGYIVAFAGLLFTGGVVGDRYGRRRALVGGIATFGVGAVVAATAPEWRILVAGRVIQGVGAACSEPGTLSLLRQLHPDPSRRLRVLGGWAAASGLALAAGPVAAGLLVEVGGWRAVFVAEALAATAAAIAGWRLLPESADPASGRADLRGQVFVAATLGAATYGLIDGQQGGFLTARVLAAWVVAALCTVAFVVVERRQDEPVIDLSLLREPTVGAGLLAAAVSTFALFAVLLLVSLELQVVDIYSGLATAAVFAPMTVAMVVAGQLGGRWAAARGPSPPLVSGLLVAAAACGWLDLVLRRPVPVRSLVGSLTVMGLGLGLVVAPMVGTVLARVPARRSGLGAAAVTAAREVGGVLGVAVLGAIVNGLLFTRLTERLVGLGIPLTYRQVVIDAVRNGAPLPDRIDPHGPLMQRYVEALQQNVIDHTVEAGKAAFVDSVRTALVVAVAVLASGAVGVFVLLRRPSPAAPADTADTPADTPTAVGPAC
jgi:EmrB/QacA subfamily drug resistance transporter